MPTVLMVAHSTALGGAESAFKNSIKLVRELGHRVIVLLPDYQGEFVSWCGMNGLECLVMPMQSACPNSTSKSFYQISQQDFGHLASQLEKYAIDVVITNTLAILHGAVLASVMKLPHVMYVHELLADSSEMQSSGMPSSAYLRLVARASDFLLCCSESVRNQFESLGADVKTGVLYPFLASDAGTASAFATTPAAPGSDAFHLLFVGVQSNRKNPVFALAVLQALRLRGHNVMLHCVGNQGPQTPRLQAAMQYRGLAQYVQFHGHSSAPFEAVEGRKINLVCATSEPFGLTITEALERGVPVIASRSGGPEHLLSEEYLFDLGDIDRCVRIVERVMGDYSLAREAAFARYSEILPELSSAHQLNVLSAALATAIEGYRDKPEEFFHGTAFFDAINLKGLSPEMIAGNIASVSGLPVAEVERLIAAERSNLGAAVSADCARYDVVPFGASSRMDDLYREGIGFAVELAATCRDTGRLLMAAFILSKLIDEASLRPMKILAFGDGIGADTMRLASMGFDVDYIDFDASVTAGVARKNFENCIGDKVGKITVINRVPEGQTYDAIICLEVIEHVSEPGSFLKYLSSLLSKNGLLFISECFDGVQNFWPTHLASNEDLGGLLPIMGCEVGLQLEDCNREPDGKPYVFRKVNSTREAVPAIVELFRNDKNLFRSLIRAQLKIGL